MNSQKVLAFLFLMLVSITSAETVPLVLGQQYNFTFNNSQYVVKMVGSARDSATFIVSGILASPGVNETKILGLNGNTKGDVSLTINQIMPNGTVSLDITYNVGGSACKPISEECSGFNDCCVGNCIIGVCSYPPTFNSTAVNASLDAPENITSGSVAIIKISSEAGKPIADAKVDVLTPSGSRLTLTTNESGEGSYLADEEGNYSYATYGYTLLSNRTTVSKPAPPPVQTPQQTQQFCGDGTCNKGESCNTCPHDCGACVTQEAPAKAQTSQEQQYSSLPWLGLMFLTIIIVLRLLIPILVR
jgi:hypothetical protein